ncbi:MAG: hypothetical protein GF313_14605 [Caldithrix sp.]|nr:hypothetical protein [Caldithrix sp.]
MNSAKKYWISFILVWALALTAVAQHVPSDERGDPKVRRKTQMEGNLVRTTVFNFGQTGRTSGEFPIYEETPYEWPKNTGKVYLALTGIFVGSEIIDEQGELHHAVDVMNYRTSPDGTTWNLEPVPGYLNPAADDIATSNDPETWPDLWPDKMADSTDPGWAGAWNGYFGKNKFNADQEIYYKASDDLYDRYQFYFPDSTDRTRKGIGMLIDVRAMAWSQVLVEDVVYILHNIKNDGTQDLEKVAFTIWLADFVGGDGDSQDDISEFDLIEDIAWSRDSDGQAPQFGNDPVGSVGVAFLETPGNAADRIDNDGDGEANGPLMTEDMIQGEDQTNRIDDNGNGLIDENESHIFVEGAAGRAGVTYADRIDANGDAEQGSPIVTQEMIDMASSDQWKRWPVAPATDPVQNGQVHLLMVESDDQNFAWADGIDNDNDGETDSPVITQAMIDEAADDAPYYRFVVPSTGKIVYNVTSENLGNAYADGLDNNGDGAVDERIDEGIDEMIDESRDDHIDNDGDWDPLADDVGLDGLGPEDQGYTGPDFGENDGKPTSGAGTGLPGEPNTDVTDVAESDQIGITNVQYIPAGGLNINSDQTLWFDLMIPGKFYDPQAIRPGEYDLLVTSSLFPLDAGQTERISLAVILGNGPDDEAKRRDVLQNRLQAQETYNVDYQFAKAPLSPTLKAVAGDGKVTLYWDDVAEQSFDSFIDGIGGRGHDFEGYRIYRASDPAFEDAYNITDAYGITTFRTYKKQFDIVNNYSGLDSVGRNGVKFDLGNNTGLKHSWVDSTVKNGFTYYYAITSYDYGFPQGDILPSESPVNVKILPDTVILDKNVARVRPEAPAAGYVPAQISDLQHVTGTSSGEVTIEIVDITKIRENHVYHLTFEDTLILAENEDESDILTTKNYTLWDSTANDTLINQYENLQSDHEQPLIDGFRMNFFNEERVGLDNGRSGWVDNENLPPFKLEVVKAKGTRGVQKPNDYRIEFGEVGFGRSQDVEVQGITFPAMDVNFKVYNLSSESYMDFGFIELDESFGGTGVLSASGTQRDRIVFLEPQSAVNDSLVISWWFFLTQDSDPDSMALPGSGDEVELLLKKPFLSADKYRFVTSGQKIDKQKAKMALGDVKVVPNPYVAAAQWEPPNIYDSGPGERALHFTHLPAECTIRIYTVNGELVDTIEHQQAINDGTAIWDMLTKDELPVAYGVYIYHIEAPGVGEKVGKFAIIK